MIYAKTDFEIFGRLYRISIVSGDVLRQCLLINKDVGAQQQLYFIIFKDLVDSCGTPYSPMPPSRAPGPAPSG